MLRFETPICFAMSAEDELGFRESNERIFFCVSFNSFSLTFEVIADAVLPTFEVIADAVLPTFEVITDVALRYKLTRNVSGISMNSGEGK